MKKKILIIALIVLLLFLAGTILAIYFTRDKTPKDPYLGSQTSDNQNSNQPMETHFCGNQTTENQTPDERIPQHRKTQCINPWDSFSDVLKNAATSQKADTKLDIPLYYEDDLLNRVGLMFRLNYDACRFPRHLSSITNEATVILASYPTNALRIREDNSSYAVYDTETGCRFYLFFDTVEPYPVGFPIMIKDMLCRMCFASIKIGDPIENVEVIDDVTTHYKADFQNIDPEGAKLNTEAGYPLASIHYLKDGILKINYTMQEDQSLVVSEIIFNENYQIVDGVGRVINYKIEDIDLPST